MLFNLKNANFNNKIYSHLILFNLKIFYIRYNKRKGVFYEIL